MSAASWAETILGEVAEIVGGATPKTSVDDYWNGDVYWATPKDLSELEVAEIDSTPRTLTQDGLRSCSARVLPPGSVLLSSRAPIGHVAINTVPMATNQGFKSLIPDRGRVDAKFLYWWLRRNRPALEAMGTGATFKEISKKTTAAVPIQLPPIEEQRRIAAVLDAAHALRAKRREALAKLDTLTQAIFIDMFGDPAANSHRWPMRSLREVAVKFSDGPFGSNLKSDHYQDSGIRVVRLQNIDRGRFVDDVAAFISKEHFASLSKHECRPGDVLVATMGDPNLRACIQPESLDVALNKADCVQVRVDDSLATSEWLCTLLNHPATEEMAQGLVRGQTRSRISMGRLRGLKVPVPPIELQAQFSARSKGVAREAERLQRGNVLMDELFGSLQQRAFRGEL